MDVLTTTVIGQSDRQQLDNFRRPRRRSLVTAAAGVAGLLLASGCSGDRKPDITTTVVTAPETTAPKSKTPFKVTRGDWASILPERAVPNPPTLDQGRCATQGLWRHDRPAPTVQKNPLIVRADGRCNGDVTSEAVGIYLTPKIASGPSPIGVLNGDALGVECQIDGEPIQDNSGPISGDTKWLGVAARDRKHGDVLSYGYVSVVNTGFPLDPDVVNVIPVCEAA